MRTLPALLLALAGCTHRPTFDRERMPDHGPPPVLARPVVVVTRYDATVEPILRERLDAALRAEASVERVQRAQPGLRVPGDATVVSVSIEPRVRAPGKNFLVAWPGFIVFAPAWHGFEWIHRVRTRVTIANERGEAFFSVHRDDELRARYTSNALGVGAGFGWFPPTYSIPALVTGIVAVTTAPDERLLQHEFALRVGDEWARLVAADVLRAIAAGERTPG